MDVPQIYPTITISESTVPATDFWLSSSLLCARNFAVSFKNKSFSLLWGRRLGSETQISLLAWKFFLFFAKFISVQGSLPVAGGLELGNL